MVREEASALARLVSPDFDPRTTALLEREPPLDPPGQPDERPGHVDIVRYQPREVVIDVDTPAAGILVLTDQDYPGWESEIDGRPAEILVTDYLFRGVPVGAGTHRVVFRFVPYSFRRGLLAAALGTLFAFGATLAMHRRRARRAVRVS